MKKRATMRKEGHGMKTKTLKVVMNTVDDVKKLDSIQLRNEKKTSFWIDNWNGKGNLRNIFFGPLTKEIEKFIVARAWIDIGMWNEIAIVYPIGNTGNEWIGEWIITTNSVEEDIWCYKVNVQGELKLKDVYTECWKKPTK